MTTQSPQINLTVPLIAGDPLEIPLAPGVPLYIVGANGTGKSALVQHAVSTLGLASVRRISAHRQTWMESGNISFSPQQRRQFGEQFTREERNPIYRWREWNPGAQLQSVLFDLTAAENAQARRISDRAYDRDWKSLSNIVDSECRVFDQLNALLAKGRLSVSIENSEGETIITHNKATGTSYSIAQMSDGERNAVIIAANVLTVKPGTVLLIDEPERHLHRAIIEPFLSALFAERPDCPFVISTHEVALPLANPGARVIVTYSCQWNGEQPSAWDAKILEPDTELPEDLKRAILGARKAMLFVEGQPQSLDQRLYSALFPDIAVIATGSYNDVIQAVRGIRQTESRHDIKAFGLIDRDDRGKAEVQKLAGERIYALDAYSVESLYYCSSAIEAVAQRQGINYAIDADGMANEAKRKALNSLTQEGIAASMAERLCIRKAEAQIIQAFRCGKNSVRGDASGKITLEVDSPYHAEVEKFNMLLSGKDLDAIVARYPVRYSRLPKDIATALRHNDSGYYQQALLALIPSNEALADNLRQRIPRLTAAIKAHLEQPS